MGLETKKLERKQAQLQKLSDEEKALLQPFLREHTRQYSLLRNIVTNMLEEKDILHRQITLSAVASKRRLNPRPITFWMSDWAYDYLRENPELLMPKR